MNDFLDRHKNYLKYLLLLSLITFVILCVARVAHGAWYDSNWQYRKQITIKGSEVTGGPHGSFPVLIQLASDTDLAADAQSNGDDILFTSSDETTKIPHEIESFNGTTGALVAWVRVDLSANPANTIIYMYYGYASATNQEQVTQVWDSDYVGVWHLEESVINNSSASGVHQDSTSNNNDGNQINNNDLSAKIAVGQDFEGDWRDEYVEIPNSATVENVQEGNYTVEAWFYSDTTPPGYDPAWNSAYSIVQKNGWHAGIVFDESRRFTMSHWLTGNVNEWTGSAVKNNATWYHVAGVVSRTAGYVKIYVNGVNEDTNTFTPWTAARDYGTTPWRFGLATTGRGDWAYPANGKIDEVRISKTARSADWLATSYSNQNNPANFVIIGSETAGGGSNNPPNVDAGSAQDVTLPNLANLDGTADDGGDGPTTPPNVEWTKQSGPGTVTFGDQYAQDTTANFSTNGTYVLRLTADDGADTAYDEVTITVYPAGGPPPVDDYSCSLKITIDNTKVAGSTDLLNFPVLVSLTEESLKTTGTGCGLVVNSDGSDIIFTDSGKTIQLDHEIEKYDGTTGELVAWVRVPSLAATTNTEIYLYYGNSNITSPQENPTGVWDSNYVAVWHLQDQNNLEDSTSYSNDGSSTNVDDDVGIIEGGQDFDGNDYITIGQPANGSLDFEENTDFCISAWFKADINTRNMTIVGQRRQTSLAFGIYDPSGDKIYFRMDDSPYHYSDSGISTGQWYHAAICYDYISGTTGYSYMYVNGVAQTTNGINTYDEMNLDSWKIGDEDRWCPTCGSVGDDEVFDGDMDEVRMSNAVRPAAWFTTSYNNQNDPSSFYSVEKQCPESVPPIAEFSCKIPITIDSSKVSGTANLVDFPVLISLTDTGLKTEANCGHVQNSNGYDIIFSDSTQTAQLDHEIEKYDGTAGELIAWVRIPTLSATADTTIYLHFGHSGTCGPTENPDGVWDSNYVGVWHLEDQSNIQDSTSYNNDGTPSNVNDDTGKIGMGQYFDGTSDYIAVEDAASLDVTTELTMEAWVNLSNAGTNQKIVGKTNSTYTSGYLIGVQTGQYPEIWNSLGTNHTFTSGSISSSQWTYLATTWTTGGNMIGYINDSQVNSMSAGSYNIGTNAGDLIIGAAPWNPDTFEVTGIIDEVRISSTARSADWIKTSYNNQNDPSSFYSVGTSSCFYLSGFSCNRKITIPGGSVSGSGNLTDFPLLIKIQNDCNLKTAANGGSIQDSSGWDIVFTDSDGFTQLDHEIEEYDGNDGDLTAWVKIPTLSGSSDTDIYMYYGKSGLTCDPSNPAGVWSNNYRGVWHLHDTSGATQDSTSYNTDGTLSGTIARGATGEIDNAFDFSTNGQVSWGDPGDGHLDAGTGSWTVSLWANVDMRRGVWEQYIRKGATSWGRGYNIEVDGSNDLFYFNILDGSYSEWGISAPTISFSLDTWTYVVGVVDRPNNRIRAYKDGGQIGTGTDISAIGSISTSSPLLIGSDWPDGLIEEVRISNTARSAEWIKTEYDNQEDPESFYTMSEDTCGGAYGFNYQYCKKITVDHTQVNSDLTNFPLLVNITGDDDLKTVANGGRVEHNLGYDIVFKTTGCGNLDHEIEKYDASAGTLVAWVKVPTLSSSTDTEVYMYYGDSNVICSPENPPGVWASNYAGIWHLDETVSDEASDGIHYDSTANDNDGSQTNNDDTDGKVGTGQMFDGNGDYIYTSNSFNNPQNFTVSAWFKTSTASGKRVVGFESNQSGTYSGSWDRHIYVGTDGKVYFGAYSGSTDVAVSTNTLNDDTWHYAVGVRDDGADYIRLYIDGSLNNSTYNASAENYSGWWRIGSYKSSGWPSGQDGFFPGGIDEVRVSNTAHSADWIIAEYKNQNDPGNFYSVSSCFEQTTKTTEGWEEEVQ